MRQGIFSYIVGHVADYPLLPPGYKHPKLRRWTVNVGLVHPCALRLVGAQTVDGRCAVCLCVGRALVPLPLPRAASPCVRHAAAFAVCSQPMRAAACAVSPCMRRLCAVCPCVLLPLLCAVCPCVRRAAASAMCRPSVRALCYCLCCVQLIRVCVAAFAVCSQSVRVSCCCFCLVQSVCACVRAANYSVCRPFLLSFLRLP